MIGWLKALKALTAMRHSGRAPFITALLARTKFDYRKEVGSGIDSSVVTAPVQWIQRAFPEARLRVMRPGGDGTRKEVEGHPLPLLIRRPNGFYGGSVLWSATVFSYIVAGNAYWLKVRNGAGRVVELWYTPHWTISPMWPADGSEFISRYEYKPGGGIVPIPVDPEDVVHFRHGLDPRNPRLGLSPLHGVIREIFTDLEASNFVASLLRNMGVPGVVISPDGGITASADDVNAVKTWFQEAFGGDRRGAPLVMGSATKISQYGFNPQQMDLSVARDVAEERVCASIGIPAAVVGFGAGLQTAKVGATMGELRKLAWTNGIMPMQRDLAATLDGSLLPDFLAAGSAAEDESEFDADGVIALASDFLLRAQAWDIPVRGGWAMVAEGREALGLDVDDSHRIYLRPFSVIEVPAGAAPRPAEADEEPVTDEVNMRGILGAKQARHEPTRAQQGYVRAMDRMLPALGAVAERRLRGFFAAFGSAARDAASGLLTEDDPVLRQAPLRQAQGEDEGGGKADGKQDELLVERILDQLNLPLHQTTFRQVYEAHYLTVAEEVSKAGELIGLGAGLPDPVARAVVAAGGRRSGLVDLTDQSRRALFDALAEGRAAGEGADQLARRIAEHVEAGPWQSAETRARTIARTETRFAQNTSTVARAQHEGIERFIVFDGRLGEGVSTPEHIARDGIVVTADEASTMAADEHPNGTLSFAPFFETDPSTGSG